MTAHTKAYKPYKHQLTEWVDARGDIQFAIDLLNKDPERTYEIKRQGSRFALFVECTEFSCMSNHQE